MRTIILAAAALVLSCGLALADCKQVATGANNSPIYQCTDPEPPAPAAPPTKCWHFNGALLCTGDIDKGKPSNCSFKSGKYVCW